MSCTLTTIFVVFAIFILPDFSVLLLLRTLPIYDNKSLSLTEALERTASVSLNHFVTHVYTSFHRLTCLCRAEKRELNALRCRSGFCSVLLLLLVVLMVAIIHTYLTPLTLHTATLGDRVQFNRIIPFEQ